MAMELREVTYLAVLLRIVTAFLLGGALGMERGLKQRPAGLRTYMLVCVGSCMIMLTNQYIFQVFGSGDPVRMGAQVVSGIGFLGAGTIIVTKHSQIKGLTTAAGLWSAAAVGLATGIGFYEAAILGSVVIFLTLTLLSRLDSRMHRKSRYFDIYVELPRQVNLGTFIHDLRHKDIVVDDLQMESPMVADNEKRSFIMSLASKTKMDRGELAAVINEVAPEVHLDIF
jgi:putative Mg2+ transporter-C (MgtC) family protein